MDPAGDLYERIVDALNDLYGVHPGHRAVHSKGVLCAGTFTATPAGAALTRAAHMQGEPADALVRFSNGGGDPGAPDYARDGRGMATKLTLPDGGATDVVSLTLPVFFVRTPADFLDLTRARKPDPVTGKPDMEKLGAFFAAHPEALPATQISLAAPRPESYARLEYHAIHAFRWVDADRSGRYVRYRWEPEAGVGALSDDEARTRGADYLGEELAERLAAGPVRFALHVTLGAPEDPTDDPTVAWPEEREQVVAGHLELSALAADPEAGGGVLVFDPVNVCDGIELSEDQILHARSRAYTVSVERRLGGG